MLYGAQPHLGEDLGRTVTGERRSEGAEFPRRELGYKYMTLQHPRRQTPEDKRHLSTGTDEERERDFGDTRRHRDRRQTNKLKKTSKDKDSELTTLDDDSATIKRGNTYKNSKLATLDGDSATIEKTPRLP